MNRCILVGTSLILSLVLGSLNAQDSVLAELYGQGVHAFFAGDMRTAHEMFTNAISQGSRDPRSYYYRGLTYASLGRPTEAEADFKTGAAVEVGSADRIYPVADSLQRVQGRTRLQIERHRQIARLTSHTQASQIQKARYEELKRSEKNVLRDRNRKPATLAPGAITQPPAVQKSDPFAGAAEAMPEKAPAKPVMPAAAPAAADPFTTPAAPATTDPLGAPAASAAADPFGTPADAPKTEPAAPAAIPPADDPKSDPFADDKPASTPAPAAPAPATPAPATPAPATPAPATPAPAAPTTPPTEKPAAEDPFK